MTYFSKYDYTIIRRHWIVLLFKFLKVFLFLGLTFVAFDFTITYKDFIGDEIVYIFLFPLIFLFFNYALIKLLLGLIKFYNDLLIIHEGELIVIKSSLILSDNIEFIDINKITKLDTYCRGFIPNILSFGILVAEQQRDEVREFYYVPMPFKALQIINDEKQRTIEERKRRYVVDETTKTNIEKNTEIKEIN